KLKTMPLVLDFDKQVYVYYKLFVFAGTGLIWLFGWSIWPLKIFIFCVYLFFLVIYRNWLKNTIGFNTHQQLLTLFFLATTPIMIDQTFTFRPEIPMMLLGFLSFMFLLRSRNRDELLYAALAGLFAGLSFLMHLNGNAIVVTGGVFLLSYKKYKAVLLYGLIAGLISITYFFDLANYESMSQFLYQLKNWPINIYKDIDKNTSGFILEKVEGLLQEHQRFFWSARVYSVSVMFFICLIFGFKELRNKFPSFLRLFLIFVLCLNLLGGFIAERYLIYYFPFMAFIIGFTLYHYLQAPSKFFRIAAIIVLLFHLSTICIRFEKVSKRNYNPAVAHNNILKDVPRQSRILAPWEFIYNEIEDRQILSYKNIEYFKFRQLSIDEFAEVLPKLQVEYIVVSDEFFDRVNISREDIKKRGILNYIPITSNDRFLVLKKRVLRQQL
ncbi:MAG TPA: glycosyltransferase family 39 protein, partial [Bacteroidales bacterium]|nr:glycosyltransferase family 39 protein [Bacteroidales bacterium]